MSNAIFELGVKHGRSRLLARLANPDEALVEAVADTYRDPSGKFMKWRFLPEGTRVDYMNDARAFFRALARTLKENSDAPQT